MAQVKFEPLDRSFGIPTNIVKSGDLSGTFHAYDCFVQQQFSSRLQAFMINYVLSVSSEYSIFK